MANSNSLVSAEAASQNFVEKAIQPLAVLEMGAVRAAMEEALAFVNTNDQARKASALAWQLRSQMYKSIGDTLLQDNMLTPEMRTRFTTLREQAVK